jgi:mono/diheme cytochrome c family protein
MKLQVFAFGLSLSTAFALCQQEAPSPQVSSDPATRGAHAFLDNGCPQCHSVHHHGGTKGPDLSDAGHRLTRDQIRNQILRGGKQMPAFGQILQGSEASDLVAYVSSLKDGDEKINEKQ